MKINRAYTQELKQNLDYSATWFPNVKLSLGDVGVLSDFKFSNRTNLKKLGVRFQTGEAGACASISHITSKAVTREIKLAGATPNAGSALAAADAGISYLFKQKHAIVFLATDCTVRSIQDQEAVKQHILKAHEAGQWEQDYVVVTELVTAGKTTVIISEGSEARYELKAKADLAPAFDAIHVDSGFSLVHDSQIGFQFFAEPGMTPLFRCLGLRRGVFRNDVLTRADPVRQGEKPGGGAAKFRLSVDEVDYEDFEPQGR